MTKKQQRELLAWFADMRLQGVHPAWIPIWCGATRNMNRLHEFAMNPNTGWPLHEHMSAPSSLYMKAHYDEGLPILKALQAEAQGDQT